ncbi:unnamed protein product [Schistosoma margrebowiei]|uniref:Uncharacterized protein n=1 Tax=Schistosoma margrebowiei TaxID=48269 RepID=A0A183MA01_9TREM|nr:unnamed protein product [Schistosoma margrebowiei]
MIKNIRFEDEGEYACQARLIKKTNSQYRPYYLYQFVNQSKFYQKSIKSNITNHFDSSIDDLFHLPMSLIKSNTAYLNVIDLSLSSIYEKQVSKLASELRKRLIM